MIIGCDDMKRKIWIFMLILGIIPFIIPLIYGIYSFIFGVTFFFDTTSGFEGLFNSILMWSFVYWPTYIIGAILIIISAIKIKRSK